MNLKLSIKKNFENAIQVEKEHEHIYLFAKYNYVLCHVSSNIKNRRFSNLFSVPHESYGHQDS